MKPKSNDLLLLLVALVVLALVVWQFVLRGPNQVAIAFSGPAGVTVTGEVDCDGTRRKFTATIPAILRYDVKHDFKFHADKTDANGDFTATMTSFSMQGSTTTTLDHPRIRGTYHVPSAIFDASGGISSELKSP